MKKNLHVSIIIPCRNEEKFIGKCLDSINSNDYPKEKIEVIIIDGMSEDKTRKIAEKYKKEYPYIKVLDNQKQIVSTALNIGIQNTQGRYVMRMDAHCIYDKRYISKCINHMEENKKIDNVGGICITLANSDTIIANSIAVALSHPFGVGNSYFRIGIKQQKYVDTVPFGCYKREVFNKVGFFDEDLVRNQDDEFNLRLIKNGGKILLVPDVISYYYARESLSKIWKMYFQYGYFKPLVAKKLKAVLTLRQLIPTIFVGGLIICGIFSLIMKPFLWLFIFFVSLYMLTNLIMSLFISIRKGLKYLFILPITFATLHFSYGIGYLNGIIDFIIFKKHKKKKTKHVTITR